jgi:hypothetical protein
VCGGNPSDVCRGNPSDVYVEETLVMCVWRKP